MENKPHLEKEASDKKSKTSKGDDPVAENLEQSAQALDREQNAHKPDEPGKTPNAEAGNTDSPEDPGLVARITAKGALSGF